MTSAWESARYGAVTIPPPLDAGRPTRARADAVAALAKVLWDKHGERRLPSDRALVAAMEACDPRDVWWVCEANNISPLYLLPTREWIRALAKYLDSIKARSVVEIGAGDGFLSRCLAAERPKLKIIATDNHAWRSPEARMNAKDKREFRGVPFSGIRFDGVMRLSATTAIKRFKPDLVIVAWPPPGKLVEEAIRAPSKLVMDISVEGDVCGMGEATWRFNKEFLAGPLEDRALCRLDSRPKMERATRVTLYYGKAHKEFFEESGR